ncbi:MAG TPA: hypothetical protein VF981_16155 [Gemmatimonadaceae bacterium]
MPVTEGTSRCADLQVLSWDQVAIDEEIRRATAAFLAASPQVTPVAGAPGMWWIGASGLDALGGESTLAGALLAIARRWHPAARVAIADSCVTARAATWDHRSQVSGRRSQPPRARGEAPEARAAHHRLTTHDSRFTTPLLIPPGHDATYLATAPIGLIPVDEAMRETLSALGIRTAGGLAALPADEVEQRWGRTGLVSWRLARGEDRRRPGLAAADRPRAASADLVPSVSGTEPVLFLVRAALERLLSALVADGRAAATLAITLILDDARGATGSGPPHTITREVRLAHPMARLVPLFERCRALLDRWSLPAPVCGVTVAVVATAPLTGEQGDLLDPAWRDPAAADAAFARLRAELGTAAIVVPVVADEHRPERAGLWLPLSERAEGKDRSQVSGLRSRELQIGGQRSEGRATGSQVAGRWSLVGESRLTTDDSRLTTHHAVPTAARQLEPPEPVDVECADGIPRVLWWRGRRLRLAHALGPERLAGDWWKDGYARDYWRCEDPDGEGTLVLFHDRSSGSDWFVQGWDD